MYDGQHFTSLSQNSSIGGCKGFTKSFPDCYLLVCNQIKFRILGEFGVLDLLVVFSRRRLGFTTPNEKLVPLPETHEQFSGVPSNLRSYRSGLGDRCPLYLHVDYIRHFIKFNESFAIMVNLKKLVLDDASLAGLIYTLLFPKTLLTFKCFMLPKTA
jgi:hypothetical protein